MKLHKAFEGAQQRYQKRKGNKKTEKEDFFTVHPKNPSLALNKRKMIKEGRGAIRRLIERWFVIDNQLITFFEKENDIDFKKNASLDGSFVLVESKAQITDLWHDRKCKIRVQIILPQRKVKPIFYYTNDMNEAKILAARIYMSSSTHKKQQIVDSIRKLAFFEVIFRFQILWRRIFKVYEKRLLRMISFQIVGINLIELANTAWLQREKLFKFWSGQVLKREKIPLLRSTFRFGEIKKQLDPALYKSSLMVREQIKKLVNTFKTRKLQRHSAIQQDIQTLLEEEEQGFDCDNATLMLYNKGKPMAQVKFDTANVKIEGNKYLSLQNLQDFVGVEFYEKYPPVKFLLENISCIATDLTPFTKGIQQELYTIRLYGLVTDEAKADSKVLDNISPNDLGLDILRKQSKELYRITIKSIDIPIKFASRFQLKADIRVKIRQGKTEDMVDKSFFINSRPFRIGIPPDKQKGVMSIKGQDYYFLIDKLDQFNNDETFKISLVLQRSNVPVAQFMKEFLWEEEFICKKSFKYEDNPNGEVKCTDSQGNKMKLKFSIEKINNLDGQLNSMEREGLRLMVGRYVIYRKRVAQIRQINRNLTVDIQLVTTGEIKAQVEMKRIKMIERNGVNMYDINNLPKTVAKSQYKWVLEFKTKNKRLVNLISSGIQNRIVQNSFSIRSYSRDKKRDIEGQVLVSIIEALRINIPPKNCNIQVRITVLGENQDLQKVCESQVISGSDNPTWVSRKYPSGQLFDLGTYFKEQEEVIRFEIINKDKQDKIIGQLDLKSSDFINIDQPGQERCLLLEDQKKQACCVLIIQALFVSTNVTRVEYQLTNDMSLFLSPDQYFHYTYLQKQYEIDQYSYSVPLSKYFPNYIEKLASTIDNERFLSPLLIDPQSKKPDKNSSPAIAYVKNTLCSQEEVISLALKEQNFQRPDLEEGVLYFKYLWRHRVNNSRQDATIQLQQKFWLRYLLEMSIYAQQNPFLLQIRDDEDENAVIPYQSNHSTENQQSNKDQVIFGWFRSKQQPDARQQQIQGPVETKSFPLIFNKIWENEESQQYADAYYLTQSGIPKELRIRIWKDLLKTEVLEYEETRFFKKKFKDSYDNSKPLYINYKEMSIKQDCLAFRQIDEDIESYNFPKLFCENESIQTKTLIIKDQKRKMRNILRVLILWSRHKKMNKEIISYSYTKGMLHILQRLVALHDDEEACFWLLNGMIRMIPRLFSTDISCLIGGRISAMRNEMTAFKAILRENLPKICDKLRNLGLPVDYLIYDSMTSFYAHFFSSDVVLRLWDLIIFNLSNNDVVAKKRALWHFMAPAYLILREKQNEIMEAMSIQQVVDIYNNGCSITYDPDWIVGEMKYLIKDIFVTGIERLKGNPGQGTLAMGFNKLINLRNTVDKALNLEETRKKYEADLSIIFNSIEEENKCIGSLLEKTNTAVGSKSLQPQYLDYKRWRTHVMARFKKVAIKDSDNVIDDLYEYDEPDLVRNDLDLSKINIYLHQIFNLIGVRMFKLRLYYGKIAEDGSFQSIEERFNDEDVQQSVIINQYYYFEYMGGYNHFKIEIYDSANEDNLVCELIIDLRELNSNRFIKKHYQMKNEYMIENPDSFKYPFPVFMISFFLQSHTAIQLREVMSNRNSAMSNFINSIKRKLPDRIDIFNKKNEEEFVKLMQGDFKRIIKEEMAALKCFLPEEQVRNTINDSFNYLEDSDFGNISLKNFQYLVKQCFFSEWIPHLEQLYKIFVKEPENSNEEYKYNEENLDDDKEEDKVIRNTDNDMKGKNIATNANLFTKIKETFAVNSPDKIDQSVMDIGIDGLGNSTKTRLPFSLRNFLVSLVLMSHCTINEKFDILYDLFDWNDGVADGLDMNSMFMLIKTIFERNLYYWPSHELYNLVEMSFDLSVASIYQVFWTNETNIQVNRNSIKLSALFQNPKLVDSELGGVIDVTEEVQDTINSYQRMFGNKIIDFNHDSSAFKNLEVLIKNGEKMLEITSKNEQFKQYRLIIFYQVSSERYMHEVLYDSNGQIVRNVELIEKDDIDEYLKRNINKLYLQGRSYGISKTEFLQKTEQIPFLQDLVRVETLYRDRLQSTLAKKKKLTKELVVLINEEDFLFVFRFQPKVMHNVEGDIQKLDQRTYRILMMEAYEQDVISDIRERIIAIMEKMLDEFQADFIKLERQKLMNNIKGLHQFFVKETNSKWRVAAEFQRLAQFQEKEGSEIIMKMEQIKHQGEESQVTLKEEERDLAAFDCYTLYKHCDLSYEWRLCKIMQKEPIVGQGLGIAGLMNQGMIDVDAFRKGPQKFFYWIEFLHHRKMGQKIWLKRRREEILMSARYSREQQRNYEQESLKFIRDQYKDVLPKLIKNDPLSSPVKKQA